MSLEDLMYENVRVENYLQDHVWYSGVANGDNWRGEYSYNYRVLHY